MTTIFLYAAFVEENQQRQQKNTKLVEIGSDVKFAILFFPWFVLSISLYLSLPPSLSFSLSLSQANLRAIFMY